MPGLVQSVFETLEQKDIGYCLLRDWDQLFEIARKGGEIDVLIQKSQLPRLKNLLAQLGFVSFHDWGHAPHHFFFAYDRDADHWIKLDVVTEIAFGSPNHELSTSLALNCLTNRQRAGSVFIPALEDEFMALLLHCVLDKERFAPSRRRRLASLQKRISDGEYISMLLQQFWPGISWPELSNMIQTEQWEALLAQRQSVGAHLASRDKLATSWRQIRNRVLRKLGRWLGLLRPRFPMVALLAPDGAGKSTLAAALEESFYFPVNSIYMGLYQKGSRTSRPGKLPGLGFGRRLITQWRRYLLGRYHQGRGRLVIFDRYTYDALLPSPRQLGRGQRLRRWLLAHACPPPDLVIMLDAPARVLYERKGEHNLDMLEQQRQSYLRLQRQLPQMIVVDATRDPHRVCQEVIRLIWHAFLIRQSGGTAGKITLANTV
jgi:thymidylate kinase